MWSATRTESGSVAHTTLNAKVTGVAVVGRLGGCPGSPVCGGSGRSPSRQLRGPGVALRQKDKVGVGQPDNPPDILAGQGPLSPILMFDRFLGLEPAVHKELPGDLIVQESPAREARYWHIGFDQAGRAYPPEDRSCQRVTLVRPIERFSTPRSKQALDTALASKMGRVETEPDHSSPVGIVGLVLLF